MTELRRILIAVAMVALVAVAAVGCGVSSSSPAKIGDGIAAGPNLSNPDPPPGPDDARLPADLVANYLAAGVEGGSDQPLDRLESFLTAPAQGALKASVDTKNPPNPLVIRLIGNPTDGAFVQDRTPVDVRYEVVGVLTDQGRVDSPSPLVQGSMRFWVKAAENDPQHSRIDEITGAPAAIMISDEAVSRFYQVQPVYFWDGGPSPNLIPDIRYVPKSLTAELRANRIVQWLVDGPSAWLSAAQRLPSGVALKSPVSTRDGRIEVNLNAAAGTGGQAGIQRLYRQLQWSLQQTPNAPAVDLSIEDRPQSNGGDDYRQFNLSWSLPAHGQKYDIVDGKVTALGVSTQPNLLASAQNANVVFGGVNRTMTVGALVVKRADGRRNLVLIRDGASVKTVDLAATADMGRPVFISNDVFLQPAGGRLYAVTAAGNNVVDVTPSRVNHIQSVSVSPDARRIAFVADGQAYLTSLYLGDNNTANVSSALRQILPGQLAPIAVAWISETSIMVAGVANGAPALWRTTADSVYATDMSSSLAGVPPSDLVAYPVAPFAQSSSQPEVLLFSGPNVYQVLYLVNQDVKLKAPFFGL
jgi:hypothetical protein